MKNNFLTLGILITTLNSGIEKVKTDILPKLEGVDEIIISHQITDTNIKPEKLFHSNKIKYFFMENVGVSRNRNNAMKELESDIGLFCDDDIVYKDGFQKIVKDFYTNNTVDVATFEFIDQNGDASKSYGNQGNHSFQSLFSLAGYDISFRRKSIGKIRFDEDFGFSKFISGEDNIFLTDCYKNKLYLKHSKEVIGFHPKGNSWNIWGMNSISDRGAVIYRIFGPLSFLVNVYFSIIKYHSYKNDIGFFKFLFLTQKGSFKFMIGK